jgi:molecular chaperone DnaK
MYKATQDSAGAEGAPQGEASNAGNAGDDVTDVDFEEVKDEEKK